MSEGRADVEILGQRLSVRGRGTPEYIHELADYLNGRIQTVRDQSRVFDPLRLSLLAGLHVVEDIGARLRERDFRLVDAVGRDGSDPQRLDQGVPRQRHARSLRREHQDDLDAHQSQTP